MSGFWDELGLWTVIIVILLVLLAVPAILIIWSLNTLFHLGIGYGFFEILAMLILLVIATAIVRGGRN